MIGINKLDKVEYGKRALIIELLYYEYFYKAWLEDIFPLVIIREIFCDYQVTYNYHASYGTYFDKLWDLAYSWYSKDGLDYSFKRGLKVDVPKKYKKENASSITIGELLEKYSQTDEKLIKKIGNLPYNIRLDELVDNIYYPIEAIETYEEVTKDIRLPKMYESVFAVNNDKFSCCKPNRVCIVFKDEWTDLRTSLVTYLDNTTESEPDDALDIITGKLKLTKKPLHSFLDRYTEERKLLFKR